MALVLMLLGAAAAFGSPVAAKISHHHHAHKFGHGRSHRGLCPLSANARDCPDAHCIEFEVENNTSNDKTGTIIAKNKCLGDVKVKFEREMPFKWFTQTKCNNVGTLAEGASVGFPVAIPDFYGNRNKCQVEVSTFAIDNKFSGKADTFVLPWKCTVPKCKTCDYKTHVDLPLSWCRKARETVLENLRWQKRHDRTIRKILNNRSKSFEDELKGAVVTRCNNIDDNIDTLAGSGSATMPRLPWLGVCEAAGQVTIAQDPLFVQKNTSDRRLEQFIIKKPASFPGAKTLKEQVEEKMGEGYTVTKFGLIEIDSCDRINPDVTNVSTVSPSIPKKGSGIIAVVCGEAPAKPGH